MFQRRHHFDLTLKVSAELQVMHHLKRQYFERNFALKTWVISAIHGRHAPTTEFRFD